ncbi:PREDICTED: uncharacterized protein LOC105555695 [Vollenhovia emeryi]|uniref:uncharacterized protein LOC105555695 n=1 Tax=Vollenhovia emeryi TaxID=411798 RepID=UPI0005F377C7|nr:PREDICTED: uncharacterized protein LOC105555695 [Vollenhovia emeryi]
MATSNLVCVICRKNTRDMKVIIFTNETLTKSCKISKIRKNFGLKYEDVVLPTSVNVTEGYHVSCYKNYIALKKKYYDEEEASTSSDVSSFEPNIMRPVEDTSQQNAIPCEIVTPDA